MEGFLGEIILFGSNFAPRSWAFCHGQILPINQNQALFSIMGTTYGGDGRTTFALPDLRGRVPIGTGSGPGLTPRNIGNRSGVEGVSLSEAQMPAHGHTAPAGGASATLQAYAGADGNQATPGPGLVLSKTNAMFAVNAYSDSDLNTVPIGGTEMNTTVSAAGSSAAHNNMQPSHALNYIICVSGTFPSRN